MSFFHIHTWELVGKTYAEPARNMKNITAYTMQQWKEMMKYVQGTTTFVWKCSDKECDAIRKEECLGKEVK
jgi:hypothetical protein